jgi:hypothetical protein
MTATSPKSVSFFPREHGATAMLLSPFVCAVILARRFSPESMALEAVALTAVVFAFAIKDPLVAVLRQRFVWREQRPESAVARRWVAVEAPVLLACGGILLFAGPRREYAWLALCEGIFGVLAVRMNFRNRQRSEWFQAVSAIALTATSLIACLAALGGIPVWGWVLWGLCALQAAAGIFVVHARLDARVALGRTGRAQGANRRAAKISIAIMAVAAAGAATIFGYRWTVPAALLLAACAYAWELRRQSNPAALKMPLTRVGVQALTLSIVYGILLIVGLW